MHRNVFTVAAIGKEGTVLARARGSPPGETPPHADRGAALRRKAKGVDVARFRHLSFTDDQKQRVGLAHRWAAAQDS